MSHYNWKDICRPGYSLKYMDTVQPYAVWSLIHSTKGYTKGYRKMYKQVINSRKSLEDEGKNNECSSSYTYHLCPVILILMGDVSSRLIMLQFTGHRVSQNDLLSMKILSI